MSSDKDNQLEQEYKAALVQVNENVSMAAKLLKEANKIANKHKKSVSQMSYEYDEETDECLVNTDDLFDALNGAGWRTSSFGC